MAALLKQTSAPPSPPPSDAIAIKCVGLQKHFRDFWLRSSVKAVDGVDLEIHQGEIFGLLGPNGSGKTTTIKMILGLHDPSAGSVFVLGRRPDDVNAKREIGYLPEESYLYGFLSARETLDYYGRLFHIPRATRMARINQLLHMVGLDAVQDRPISRYSKGMQRRIGLAQALINDPKLLILDEPTVGLDPIGTRQIKDVILELGKRGKTIILCSHLLADVEDVCHRVAIMFGGKVRRLGAVNDLLARQDLTTIQTSALDGATLRDVERTLEKHGKVIDRVENPRQKLEALFLDIVTQAQREGASTSGAAAGGPVAKFLRGDDASSPAAASKAVIDLLTKPASPAVQTSRPPGKNEITATIPQPVAPHVHAGLPPDTKNLPLTPSPSEPSGASDRERVASTQPGATPGEGASDFQPGSTTDQSVINDLIAGWGVAPSSSHESKQSTTSPAEKSAAPSFEKVTPSSAAPDSKTASQPTPDSEDDFDAPPTQEELSMMDSLIKGSWLKDGPVPSAPAGGASSGASGVAPDGEVSSGGAGVSPASRDTHHSPSAPETSSASQGALADLMAQVPPAPEEGEIDSPPKPASSQHQPSRAPAAAPPPSEQASTGFAAAMGDVPAFNDDENAKPKKPK